MSKAGAAYPAGIAPTTLIPNFPWRSAVVETIVEMTTTISSIGIGMLCSFFLYFLAVQTTDVVRFRMIKPAILRLRNISKRWKFPNSTPKYEIARTWYEVNALISSGSHVVTSDDRWIAFEKPLQILNNMRTQPSESIVSYCTTTNQSLFCLDNINITDRTTITSSLTKMDFWIWRRKEVSTSEWNTSIRHSIQK